MDGTIIDTSSLIALAFDKRMRDQSDLLSGIEAFLISENIIIDYPSYKRNILSFPDLKRLKKVAEFINVNDKDEEICYEKCADVIVPLMNRPDDFLVDIYRRHTTMIDCCELSINREGYPPSTTWSDISIMLSKGESNLVKALESKFGKYTPFSGAALTNLIRFLYYTVCQDIYKCNLSLHYEKSSLLTGLWNPKFGGNEKTAKTIIEVFDKETTEAYKSKFNKWIGDNNHELKIPLLIQFIEKNRSKHSSLIKDLINIRDLKICKDFRLGIKDLQNAIDNMDIIKINKTLASIENFTNKIKEGEFTNPNRLIHKIEISIPFVGGLGTEISVRRPKFKKTTGEKIIIFLHQAIY
jgi:hypothetical protein